MSAFPRIDWIEILYPGRREPFTAEEMARAGGDYPGATLRLLAGLNFGVPAGMLLKFSPPSVLPGVAAVLVVLFVLGWVTARWLWTRPWRRPLLLASHGVVLVMLVFAVVAREVLPLPEQRHAVGGAMVVGGPLLVAGLWLLVSWRAHAIEARLREQAERAKAVEMARRLAAAQLEPHFLYNTLASLQHWVQTQDPRAAPLLSALTGYLRATLPLFDRPRLPAGDELLAVQRYLEVMQARLGARLDWKIDVPEALRRALLPPGLLLTLAENAVVHAVEPSLHAVHVVVASRRDGTAVVFEVQDDGPGPPPGLQEGFGLSNLRASLQLAFGDAARLSLARSPGGGCRAEIRLPFQESPA